MSYICERCGGRLDPGEGRYYAGEGFVCEECEMELDMEAEHRKQFCLTKEQQADLKKMLPGLRLGSV